MLLRYIWKRGILLNYDIIFLEKTGLYVLLKECTIDIDTEYDYKYVEFLMREKLEKRVGEKEVE